MLPLCTNPKSVYNLAPISDAVICIVPHLYSLASFTTRDSSSLAIPFHLYSESVNMLDSNPILPLMRPKYGGFSTNDMPLVPIIFSPSKAIKLIVFGFKKIIILIVLSILIIPVFFFQLPQFQTAINNQITVYQDQDCKKHGKYNRK